MDEKPRWSYRKLTTVFLALVILVTAAFITWKVYTVREAQRTAQEYLSKQGYNQNQ